ncbi:RecT family recombinase [Citrobacter freundii]|uniref:RecT family recombinase n=1 Tax=Citrobacter freundii TaxID=546 RepID=UPI000B5A92F0|nr:RecT family recombinase [Citrobacter freundii]ASK03364.1 enterohemolysin [Citrobacter freundii]MDV1214345.1 RecT family recombinase [Citrobacter freundii]MDV1774345.1 RecT family recombinase [Citrobacter freundii]MEB0390934.1 RecT family recombinase [Citrobacter freundii]MEB0452778.1 RecT family recombinase [Citrobacter freundii]
MQNTNIIAAEQTPNTISASNAIFNVQALTQLQAVAGLMAQAAVTVPEHLRGNPADCMAIIMQAMQWGMNPYAVAQKTHLVNGVLGYEAQLVNAVISSSNAIVGRFHYEYEGDWSKCASSREEIVKKPAKGGGTYDKKEMVRGWTSADEQGLSVRVGAVIRGESEITWGEPVFLSSVITRNSPLWISNPKQQIAYLALKYWARLYCPAVVLGVYTPDEVEPRTEKEINPAPQRVNLADITGDTVTTTHSAQESAANIDGLADDFRDRIEAAQDVDSASAVRADIETAKAALGSTLYTELKNKAVKRYHLADQRNKVEAAINSLPQPGEPDAAERFEEAERVLAAAKRHMGDELHDKFSITLADMKPEYVA